MASVRDRGGPHPSRGGRRELHPPTRHAFPSPDNGRGEHLGASRFTSSRRRLRCEDQLRCCRVSASLPRRDAGAREAHRDAVCLGRGGTGFGVVKTRGRRRGNLVTGGGRGHATKRHGARWSQVRLPRPDLYDPDSLRLLRCTLPADPDIAGSEARGTQPLQVQVDGSRRVFGPLFLVSRRLFLTLAGNGEAGHDGCDGNETDTQGTNRRLPR